MGLKLMLTLKASKLTNIIRYERQKSYGLTVKKNDQRLFNIANILLVVERGMIKKILILLLFVVAIGSFFLFDLSRFATLEYIKSAQASFEALYASHPVAVISVFMLAYIAMTGLTLPGATLLTLLAGALFGVVYGSIMVSFASTIGASIAFLLVRYLFHDVIQARYKHRLEKVNAAFAREGALYLLTLRLVPLFPFFLVNILMALTPMRLVTFFLVSQIGMLPATIIYVYAGQTLASIESLKDIVAPHVIIALSLLGIFPLMVKKLIQYIKTPKFKKPSHYDYNAIVIGAGSGGLVSAYIAAALKAKVLLVEKDKMGGDCLNTGCVPSKAFIRTAKMLHYAKHSKRYGIKKQQVEYDFAAVMRRVRQVVKQIEPHDSVERYQSLGVECVQGEARIKDPYHVQIGKKIFTTKNIIVATGASPLVPPIPGLDQIAYLTSDNLWQLKTLPKKLVVLGGGPIGCELAQAFARLGSHVTQVEMMPRVLLREDEEFSAAVTQQFEEEGIRVLTDHKAKAFKGKQLICEHQGKEVKIPFDQVIIALGRRANVTGFGLEALAVTVTPQGTVQADPYMRTNIPNIYVCGDVTGPYQFTHVAAHQAWYAMVNALLRPFKSFRADYRVIPWATFTDPEIARVGLNEQEAKERGIAYEVAHYGIDDLDRAIADSEDRGLVKVLTVPGKDKILGVTIMGAHAGNLIAEFVLAMKHNLGLNKILETIHIYPTMAEANKYVAGNWRKAHLPECALSFLHWFHRYRRRGQ